MATFDHTTPADDIVRAVLSDPEGSRSGLRALGFRDPDRAARNLQAIAQPEGAPPLPAGLFRELAAVPDPDMALNNLDRLLQTDFGRAAIFRSSRDDPAGRGRLLFVLGASQFLADILVRDPEYLYWLTEFPEAQEQRRALSAVAEDFVRELGPLDALETRLDALKQLSRRELLRIGTADLVSRWPIHTVAEQLSDLADVVIQTVLDLLVVELDSQLGVPTNADGSRARFSVVALGKLGGRELNFSSDIDLMFVYSEEGRTEPSEPGGRSVTNHEYFSRLAERILKAATEPSSEGFLYRIDVRLRPEGASGALAMSLSGYESYYVRRGELWERQMLIKARPCAGSERLGCQFLERIRPFVYPRHFEASPVEEIRRIKRRIEDHIARRGLQDTHLKLRQGGIRDIEFIVQCLQLLVGRIHEEVRSPNSLQAIDQLGHASALSHEEATALRLAYIFFRRLEHRRQMMHGLSDYSLPEMEAEQISLARSLGIPDVAAYRSALERHLAAVRRIYTNIFSETREGEGRPIGAICDMPMEDPEAAQLLTEFGFVRPEEAHRNLILLAFGHLPRVQGARARQSFIEQLPVLMHALRDSPDPDLTLSELERVVSTYGASDTLFRLFGTNPGFRDLLLSICAGSPFLVGVIVRNPALLDWITLPDVLFRDRSPEELRSEAQAVVARADTEDRMMAALTAFRCREILRIGTRDLLKTSDTFQTFEALSLLADTIVQEVHSLARERLRERRGVPPTADGSEATFVVLGLGKLGGLELNFGSDLDLVFVYSEDGKTDGPKPVGNQQYFIELSQQILNMLGQSTPYGTLYPVDARLRPEGGRAMLALSADAYDHYLTDRAATWERLALSRSRLVSGDPDLGQRVLDRIERFVVGTGLSEEEVTELVGVRGRMEEKSGRGASGGLSIKTGPGGIVDIEYIAQALQIRNAAGRGDLRTGNTLESLRKLSEAGYLDQKDAQQLQTTFGFLREVEKILRRQDERARTRLPEDEAALTSLARALGHKEAGDFLRSLRDAMAQIRQVFKNCLGDPG